MPSHVITSKIGEAESRTNERALRWLADLIAARFWGSLTIKFEAGRICHIRKEESVRPEELSEIPKVQNDKQKAL